MKGREDGVRNEYGGWTEREGQGGGKGGWSSDRKYEKKETFWGVGGGGWRRGGRGRGKTRISECRSRSREDSVVSPCV